MSNEPSTKNLHNSQTKFRRAELSDLEEVVDLVHAVYKVHHNIYGIGFDSGSVVATCHHVIHNGICLLGHGAVAGGKIVPFLWNRKVLVGTVIFWGFLKPSGVRIIEAIAVEFQKRGAAHINCASHFPDNSTGRFYERIGMHAAETQFVGEISR